MQRLIVPLNPPLVNSGRRRAESGSIRIRGRRCIQYLGGTVVRHGLEEIEAMQKSRNMSGNPGQCKKSGSLDGNPGQCKNLEI